MTPFPIRTAFLAGLIALGLGGSLYYWRTHADAALRGLAFSNGRIEAQTTDVATRYAARVVSVPVEEGQMIAANTIVATLDMGDLAASLDGAKANASAATQRRDAAAATLVQAQSALALAQKEFARADALARDQAVSQSRRDQALNALQSAKAQVDAAQGSLAAASDAIAVAQADVARLNDLLKDRSLHSPIDARVLYKLAEPGEVLPAGGKAVTLLDPRDVYMTIFLPTDTVGKLHIGDEARIVVDALPDMPIPAYVSYISPEAQFTPRQVETRSEREKLTFRVKVRIPPALLARHLDAVRTGLPGMAYIRIDRKSPWPDFLKADPTLLQEAAGKDKP